MSLPLLPSLLALLIFIIFARNKLKNSGSLRDGFNKHNASINTNHVIGTLTTIPTRADFNSFNQRGNQSVVWDFPQHPAFVSSSTARISSGNETEILGENGLTLVRLVG